MWTVTPDGSVTDASGKVIFFSTRRFVEDVCVGDCCFICGALPGSRPFNDEHILPEWLLRQFDLFDKTIFLPNEGTVKYSGYTVPCCAECNSLMGKVVETPLSEVIRKGADALNTFISQGDLLKVFVWMGLIYLKTHLKDKRHRVHLDRRKADTRIADEYEWEELHHIHSVVRCFYNGCSVEPEALGSFLSLPVRGINPSERFDFCDLYLAQVMLLRLDDVALLAVFNDSGGAMSFFRQKLERITGPVSELQLREILAELAYLNLRLRNRPIFRTDCDVMTEECRIVGFRPELALQPMDLKLRGRLLHYSVRHALPHLHVIGRSQSEVEEALKAGTFTFLFKDNGDFIGEPPQRVPDNT